MRSVYGALLFVTIIVGNSLQTAAKESQCSFDVATVHEIGTVGGPASVTARDGGATAIIGNKLLWTFGDTLFNPKAEDGTNMRSNTAALADPASPLVVTEVVDSQGAPFQFLPLKQDEQAYNDQTGKPDDRIALWPTSVIRINDKSGLVFYLKLKVKPGFLNFEFLGIGLAEVQEGKTVAIRHSNYLFNGFPLFDNATLIGSDVYIYGNILDGTKTQPLAVARVPLKQIEDRKAWRFWDGKTWTSDFHKAVAVVRGVSGAVSVSYNACLQSYLMVYSDGFSNNIVMRTAPNPEGAWSKPIKAFTGLIPSWGVNYAGREHPELATDGGRTIAVTYYHPRSEFSGELRFVNVTFK